MDENRKMVDTNGGHIYMYTLAFVGHIFCNDKGCGSKSVYFEKYKVI